MVTPRPEDYGNVYDKRSPNAIKRVSAKCSKLYGIEGSTLRPTGSDDCQYLDLVNYNFNQRLAFKFGAAEEVRLSYNYLKDKPKWSSYAKSQDTTNTPHSRPPGKRRRRK